MRTDRKINIFICCCFIVGLTCVTMEKKDYTIRRRMYHTEGYIVTDVFCEKKKMAILERKRMGEVENGRRSHMGGIIVYSIFCARNSDIW